MTQAHRNKWASAGIWLLRAFALFLIAGTAASITDSDEWYIRIWDFPRLQILFAMLIAAGALWYFDRGWRPWLPLVLAGLCGWQFYLIYPYTPLAAPEVAMAPGGDTGERGCFSVLTLNVLQSNSNHGRTAKLIRDTDPDIVLLMETDQKWGEALELVLQDYPEKFERLLDNKYGLIFATRLPMKDASIEDLVQKDTPSAFATLTAGDRDFQMIGLHPRPPSVSQDTTERDGEIILSARRAKNAAMPALAIGDFNDVAWSKTTRSFTDIGDFLDPRIGRGTYATFPADMTWLGWPLDHLFVTKEFSVREMRVERPVGSDHRPVFARLCLAPLSEPEG